MRIYILYAYDSRGGAGTVALHVLSIHIHITRMHNPSIRDFRQTTDQGVDLVTFIYEEN